MSKILDIYNSHKSYLPHAIKLTAIFSLLVATGCSTTISEKHYFAAYKEKSDGDRDPVQFYRVSVDGDSHFTNTRFLTGYYDERAISLFFNEIKAPTNQKLFDDNMTLPGSGGTKITPLSPSADNGAFVLIMSTNADSIANTIGSFAESQTVADSLTRLINRDRFMAKSRSDSRLSVSKAEATSLVAQLRNHTEAATQAQTSGEAANSYRRALTVLAQSLGYSGPEFDSLAKAREWFALDATLNSGGAQ